MISATVVAAASSARSSPRVRFSSTGSFASLASKAPPSMKSSTGSRPAPCSHSVVSRMLRRFLPALLLPLLAAGCGGSGDGGSNGARPTRPVTLVLDFTPNAAHAGIYAAVAGHRDRDHGVKLTIRQPTASSDSL